MGDGTERREGRGEEGRGDGTEGRDVTEGREMNRGNGDEQREGRGGKERQGRRGEIEQREGR